MFKKSFLSFVCLSLFLFVVCIAAHAQADLKLSGLKIMQQYQRLHEVDSEYTRSSMTLVNQKGRKRVRTMQTYEKKPFPTVTNRPEVFFSFHVFFRDLSF